MVVSDTPLPTNKIPVFSKERNFDEKITRKLDGITVRTSI